MTRAGVFRPQVITPTVFGTRIRWSQTVSFVLAFLCLQASLFAQRADWVDGFDKIHDSDTLAKLRAHQKHGWEHAFQATGKSAAALTGEAEFEMQQLRNIIATDSDAITRAKISPAVFPTAARCKAALAKPSDPLFPVCDKSLRQDQLLAISGILKLLPAYQGSLPKPEPEGHFGKNLSNEVVATVKIRVLSPEPAAARALITRAPGSPALVTSFADDGSTHEVHQGDNVVIQLAANGKRTPGFVVDPVGILATKPGVAHFDTNRMIILQAVKPGLVTITFRGPFAVGASNSLAIWSGYQKFGGPFWGVKGQWQVPQIVTQYSPYGASSTWIGLSGAGEFQLIQIGTSQYYNAPVLGIGGGVSYYPWWQLVPENLEQRIDRSVNPGDWMFATITPVPVPLPPNEWRMTLTNITQGWTFSVDQPYGGPFNSAEWIEEDDSRCIPLLGCPVQTLDNYGQVTFDYNTGVATSVDNLNQPIWVPAALTANEQLTINQSNSIFYSIPGPPSCDGDGFLVTYSNPSVGTKGATWNQNTAPGPIVDTSLLGPAQLDVPYSQTLAAYDPFAIPLSEGNWSWTLVPGHLLPDGLTLNSSSGVISGKPEETGNYSFSVTATDNSTWAHASSCPQNLSINVSLTALSTLQINCGSVAPPSPVATIVAEVDGAPATCGTLTLPPGAHTVSGSVEYGGADTEYKMIYGNACKQSGPPNPLTNPPAVVQLVAGQVQQCEIAAESVAVYESGGCRAGQKCCERDAIGCKICVNQSLSCP